jgi:hypothetical protein
MGRHDLHQTLNESYLLTQYPYRCPNCRRHRTFLNPNVNPIPYCPDCGLKLVEDVAVPTNDYIQMGPYRQETKLTDFSFLHTYTPAQAITIIDTIPDDSFHWPAIMWNKVEEYAELVSLGKWTTVGQYWHPVRFNSEGNLLTGAQRILACFLADSPMPNWTVDHSQLWFKDSIWVRPM